MKENNLQRFVDAQQGVYEQALSQIKGGRKQSHWMWFVFPQIDGLGYSEISKRYGIKSMAEAEAYLQHPLLGVRLLQISEALLQLGSSDAYQIFGSPDDLKLKSSMTLFSSLPNAPVIFRKVLDKFFAGAKDPKTLRLLEQPS
ncbi:MAG TPA: DUF1810 domain-containing protein [Flavisolibacter sp.]|jgi:uncharacterized protein (DUF1810 family)|nr:DUF1810 domain-containing protein [Flavisolibacter sp.]